MDSIEAWPAVEIGVEAEDGLDSVTLHDGDVDGIAGGVLGAALGDLAGTEDVGLFDSEDLVDDGEQDPEGGRDGVTASDGRRAVEDLLENFGVGDQAVAGGNLAFREVLAGGGLVGKASPLATLRHNRPDIDREEIRELCAWTADADQIMG